MLAVNSVLQNRYQIIRSIGKGGMGAVYLAKDQRLGNTVALKQTFFQDETMLRAFEREARLLANMRHPALPRVSDHFSEEAGQFLVMEYISGEDLWERLQNRGTPFPPAEVLAWADQLLDALDYLHTQQPPIIHRDIKPQNLKLTERNQVILLDFGLAKGHPASQGTMAGGSQSIFAYTPDYAPIEQMKAEGTSARSDLYSLAATLYHLLTGVTPPNALARVSEIATGRPDPLRPPHEINPQVPPAVSNVLFWALRHDINQRPPSAEVMRQALRDAASRPFQRPQPGGFVPPTVVGPPAATAPPGGVPTNPRGGGATYPPQGPASWPQAHPPGPASWPQQPPAGQSNWPQGQSSAPQPPSSWPQQQQQPQPGWNQPRPLAQPMPYPPARKSNAALYVIGGLAALVVVGIVGLMLIGMLARSQNANNVNTAPAAANRSSSANANRPGGTPILNQNAPGGVTPPYPQPPTTPTAGGELDQTLDNYITALGGREAIQSITSFYATGTLDYIQPKVSGTVEIYQKAPNKRLVIQRLNGQSFVDAFDGSTAWQQNPQEGVKQLSGNDLADSRRSSDFYSDLNLRSRYTTLTVAGREKVNGRETIVLQGTVPTGGTDKLYFDAQGGLKLREDNQRSRGPFSMTISEYKTFGGVNYPVTWREQGKDFTLNVKIKDVQVNVPIDDSRFAKPAK